MASLQVHSLSRERSSPIRLSRAHGAQQLHGWPLIPVHGSARRLRDEGPVQPLAAGSCYMRETTYKPPEIARRSSITAITKSGTSM
jgi:hypothetical protein